ncbi:MAG: hypothetical protein HXY40_04965 [Chloroflexi bacterium]|nr:hypothetical protein [Chloroflexota bacterium]
MAGVRIHTISIDVDNMQQALRFWRDFLKLPVRAVAPASDPFTGMTPPSDANVTKAVLGIGERIIELNAMPRASAVTLMIEVDDLEATTIPAAVTQGILPPAPLVLSFPKLKVVNVPSHMTGGVTVGLCEHNP